MTTEDNGAQAGRRSAADVTGLLAKYPHISSDDLGVLKTWFSKASALDIALLASREETKDGYSAFRREHVDKLSLKEVLLASAITLAVIVTIALIGYRSI